MSGAASPPGDGPLVRLCGVSCGYDRRVVLHDVDLDLASGAVTALVGANGSGKTTLLRVLLGLLPALAGRVEYAGARPPRVGYVPQVDLSEVLFPVSALDVVLMGLTPQLGWLTRPRAEHRRAARSALETFGVGDLGPLPFRDLSGGQRQRVLLSRGVVADPELLVLDEPVRGLDFASSATLVETISELAQERGMAVVVATHSLDLVANRADHVALLRRGEFRAGPADEIVTSTVLSEVHGRPITVREVAGQRVVLTDEATRP
jgi:ABC-type Mn2+/Zn2+ transport system ATPase subunit